MKRWFEWLGLIALTIALQACTLGGQRLSEVVPVPGGTYSWGTSQRVEDFVDVEIAQSTLILFADVGNYWAPIKPPPRGVISHGNLRRYYQLRARWKLKDGRQFVVDALETAPLVREYFRLHGVLKTIPEREGRAWSSGDGEPLLAHDIKGDTLRLKWIVPINRTPLNERLRKDGAANPWTFEYEEHLIAVVKGVPTTGIDFTKTYEPSR